jgi:uncharacterized membrane protein
MSAALGARSLLSSPVVRLGAGGWIFFVAENAILSENRTALIATLGDDNYHLLYGTFSTAATAAIGYSYYKLKRLSSSGLQAAATLKVPALNRFTSWSLISVGLILASQALPKMQIPVGYSGSESGGASKLQVRCPFDFADQKRDVNQVHGMERISRHTGLWSFGLVGAGTAALQTHPALRVWWYGPALIAWLGGMHSDSRFRRNMGGTLDPWYDNQTSNVPFVAMVSGKQGPPAQAFQGLLNETKLLNALCAVGVATLMVLSRGRVR